jgi:hypothetical protein
VSCVVLSLRAAATNNYKTGEGRTDVQYSNILISASRQNLGSHSVEKCEPNKKMPRLLVCVVL